MEFLMCWQKDTFRQIKFTKPLLSLCEYAVDDWGIAAMAQKDGKDGLTSETFSKRAHYYKNYFDSSIHFIRPKLEDGS